MGRRGRGKFEAGNVRRRRNRRGGSEEAKWLGALPERNRSPSTCFIGLPESKII